MHGSNTKRGSLLAAFALAELVRIAAARTLDEAKARRSEILAERKVRR